MKLAVTALVLITSPFLFSQESPSQDYRTRSGDEQLRLGLPPVQTSADFESYRSLVSKEYLAAYDVIYYKLDKATNEELAVYTDKAKKLKVLRDLSLFYLDPSRQSQPLDFTTNPSKVRDVSLKGMESFRIAQFDKAMEKMKAIKIIYDIQTPVTREQLKSGKDFLEALKDAMSNRPKN